MYVVAAASSTRYPFERAASGRLLGSSAPLPSAAVAAVERQQQQQQQQQQLPTTATAATAAAARVS